MVMEDNADSQASCYESADGSVTDAPDHECSDFHSLADLRLSLASTTTSSKKLMVDETPAPCSSPSSSFSPEASFEVEQISTNSVLNKRKLADKLNILALARQKCEGDSSDEDEADSDSQDSPSLFQTNKRGKSTVSSSTFVSSRPNLKNALVYEKLYSG